MMRINPAHIVLLGSDVGKEDVESAREKCREIISERHIPTLSLDVYGSDNYINGLIRLTLDNLQYQFS